MWTFMMGIATRKEEPNQIGLKLTYNTSYEKDNETDKFSLSFELYYYQDQAAPIYPEPEYSQKYQIVNAEEFDWALNAANNIMNAVRGAGEEVDEELPFIRELLTLFAPILQIKFYFVSRSLYFKSIFVTHINY